MYTALHYKHKQQGNKIMSKIKNKTTQLSNDLLNLGLLLTVLSGAYAVYVVSLGTEGIIPKLLVAPLAIWITGQLIHRFTK